LVIENISDSPGALGGGSPSAFSICPHVAPALVEYRTSYFVAVPVFPSSPTDVHVSFMLLLVGVLAAKSVTFAGAVTSATTVTVAVPLFVGSAMLVARTVTVAGFGTVAGAMYTPAGVIVPFDEPPSTDHVTPAFVVPCTSDVNG